MAKTKGLGRGLDALFADAAPITEEERDTAPLAGSKKKPAPKIDKKNPEAVKAEEERLR